jgi:hypothetical protein
VAANNLRAPSKRPRNRSLVRLERKKNFAPPLDYFHISIIIEIWAGDVTPGHRPGRNGTHDTTERQGNEKRRAMRNGQTRK